MHGISGSIVPHCSTKFKAGYEQGCSNTALVLLIGEKSNIHNRWQEPRNLSHYQALGTSEDRVKCTVHYKNGADKLICGLLCYMSGVLSVYKGDLNIEHLPESASQKW